MTHTPGPWKAEFDCPNESLMLRDYVSLSDYVSAPLNFDTDHAPNGNYAICKVAGPDRRANARLIAAAPDMLAALKSMVDHFKVGGSDKPIGKMLEYAVAAIAKAEGK